MMKHFVVDFDGVGFYSSLLKYNLDGYDNCSGDDDDIPALLVCV